MFSPVGPFAGVVFFAFDALGIFANRIPVARALLKTPRHTYVHFSCNAHAKKARKEKDGGAIGKAKRSVFCGFSYCYVVCCDRMMGALEASGIGSEAGVHR